MAGLVPAIHVFLCRDTVKTWMPGTADKFTQSAQGRLLCPGMTSLVKSYAIQFARISALIMSAAFSPIMMVGALVLPPIKVGITDASTMRRPSSP